MKNIAAYVCVVKEFFFAPAPMWLLRRKNSEITQGQKLLYALLAKYAGDKYECWPSQKRLAKELGQALSTTQTQFAALQRLGLIEATLRRSSGRPSLVRFPVHPWMPSPEKWRSMQDAEVEAAAIARTAGLCPDQDQDEDEWDEIPDAPSTQPSRVYAQAVVTDPGTGKAYLADEDGNQLGAAKDVETYTSPHKGSLVAIETTSNYPLFGVGYGRSQGRLNSVRSKTTPSAARKLPQPAGGPPPAGHVSEENTSFRTSGEENTSRSDSALRAGWAAGAGLVPDETEAWSEEDGPLDRALEEEDLNEDLDPLYPSPTPDSADPPSPQKPNHFKGGQENTKDYGILLAVLYLVVSVTARVVAVTVRACRNEWEKQMGRSGRLGTEHEDTPQEPSGTGCSPAARAGIRVRTEEDAEPGPAPGRPTTFGRPRAERAQTTGSSFRNRHEEGEARPRRRREPVSSAPVAEPGSGPASVDTTSVPPPTSSGVQVQGKVAAAAAAAAAASDAAEPQTDGDKAMLEGLWDMFRTEYARGIGPRLIAKKPHAGTWRDIQVLLASYEYDEVYAAVRTMIRHWGKVSTLFKKQGSKPSIATLVRNHDWLVGYLQVLMEYDDAQDEVTAYVAAHPEETAADPDYEPTAMDLINGTCGGGPKVPEPLRKRLEAARAQVVQTYGSYTATSQAKTVAGS